jgi:hypothetical protein
LKLELEMYLKEPATTDILKKIGSIKIYLSTFDINFFNCSDLVYDQP